MHDVTMSLATSLTCRSNPGTASFEPILRTVLQVLGCTTRTPESWKAKKEATLRSMSEAAVTSTEAAVNLRVEENPIDPHDDIFEAATVRRLQCVGEISFGSRQ